MATLPSGALGTTVGARQSFTWGNDPAVVDDDVVMLMML